MKIRDQYQLFIKTFVLTAILWIILSFMNNEEKPIKYKVITQTIVLTTDMGVKDIKQQILQNVKIGYVVKSVSGAGEYGHTWLAVMERKIKIKN